ncbi:MAG: hypothetical protein L6406_14495 [Desulfobacterales bacterium]|nr:hypothetical protein [Desulfobacterales bacterium]
MRVRPLTATLGANLNRLLYAHIALAPAHRAGHIASGLLLPSSLAVGALYKRRLNRDLSATAAYGTPGTFWPLSTPAAEGTIKFVIVLADLRGAIYFDPGSC